MKHLAHRNELHTLFIDVLLINLIGHNQDTVPVTNLNYLHQVFSLHNLSCWIARVDYNDSSGSEPIFLSLYYLFLESLRIKTPTFFFFQVVRYELSIIKSEKSRVKWILWNWYQNSIMRISYQSSKTSTDTLRGTISQINIVSIRLYAVTIRNELSDFVSHVGPTFRVYGVSTGRRFNVSPKLINSLLSVVADSVGFGERVVN